MANLMAFPIAEYDEGGSAGQVEERLFERLGLGGRQQIRRREANGGRDGRCRRGEEERQGCPCVGGPCMEEEVMSLTVSLLGRNV